jgi:2-acylglycerol O-acyltransferase 2
MSESQQVTTQTETASVVIPHQMPPMALWKEIIAWITLGLFCGWYYIVVYLYMILIPLIIFYRSYTAGTIFAIFITLTYIPLRFEQSEWFINLYIWEIWKEYFDFSYDCKTFVNKLSDEKRYIFFEFPHAVFPMGQTLSASILRDITPGKKVCGSGANVVFAFPVLRQIIAALGIRKATKEEFQRTFEQKHYAAVFPGGIAEMFLVDRHNHETESIYFRNRLNTVKLAIQQGANIIPVFFFGNTNMFDVIGNKQGDKGWLASLSRKLKMSIMFFYGKFYVTVPYRTPLKMVSGEIIEIIQNDNPEEKEIKETMEKVMKALYDIYEKKKPSWESRRLVIL